MHLSRNTLYSILFIGCIAGYIWLYFGFNNNTENKGFEVCLIKLTTNVPCPSCGSTRSVISLIKGQFDLALKINPLGYIIALTMLLAPVWIIIDVVLKKQSLFAFYQKCEVHLKRPQLAIPLVLLVIINWIWNITKGL